MVNWDLVAWVQGTRREGFVYARFKMSLCRDDSVSGCFTLVESCDYSFCYFVCYQQAVFIVSSCKRVFRIVLFITVFVLCHGTKKMLIVISGFACIYKCIFLIIIFNLSSFLHEKRGKVCSALLSLAKKLIS